VDIVVLDYHALDGVVTTAYMNTRQREKTTIHGYATKMVDKNLYADKISE
jgi:hypothetical protein